MNGGDKQLSGAALIAQKRAEISAKMSAMKNTALGVSAAMAFPAPTPIKLSFPTSAPVSSPSPIIASGPTPPTGSPAPSTPVTDDINRRVAEARRRVAEAQSKLAIKDNPYMVSYPILFLCHHVKCPTRHPASGKRYFLVASVNPLIFGLSSQKLISGNKTHMISDRNLVTHGA